MVTVSLLEVSAVVGAEVHDGIVHEAEPVESIEDLPYAPVHILHLVTVRTMCALSSWQQWGIL